MSFKKINYRNQLARLTLLSIMCCLAACSSVQKDGEGRGVAGVFIKRNVSAFERGYLSKHGMEFIGNAQEEESVQHMFNAREGSVGGFGGAGGGCGCN